MIEAKPMIEGSATFQLATLKALMGSDHNRSQIQEVVGLGSEIEFGSDFLDGCITWPKSGRRKN